jgi:hypothetical protein
VFILVRVLAARGAEEEELEVVTMTYNEEILDSWILHRCKHFSVFFIQYSWKKSLHFFEIICTDPAWKNLTFLVTKLNKEFTSGSGYRNPVKCGPLQRPDPQPV